MHPTGTWILSIRIFSCADCSLDRDTWFAASIARDIAWKGSENVPTKDWVTVSQK